MAIEFTEDFEWAKEITFKAESFQKWVKENLPYDLPTTDNFDKDKAIQIGNKWLYIRKFPTHHIEQFYPFIQPRLVRSYLIVWNGDEKGKIMFDAPVGIPILCNDSGEPWMSLTPNEVYAFRDKIKVAHGKVGIAGLGMGWLARRVSERDEVDSVDVVEIDENIIEFFGKQFNDKVRLIHDDAYNHDWLQYDVVIWDIWMNYDDSMFDDRFKCIRDMLVSYGKVCLWWGL